MDRFCANLIFLDRFFTAAMYLHYFAETFNPNRIVVSSIG